MKKLDKFDSVALLLFAIINTLFIGFVYSQLWNWFIVPYFHMAKLNIPISIGIILLVRVATYIGQAPTKEQEQNPITTQILFFCVMLIWWFTGFIVTLFL